MSNLIVPGTASDIDDGLMRAFRNAAKVNDYESLVSTAKELRKRGVVEKAETSTSNLIVAGTLSEIKSGLTSGFENAVLAESPCAAKIAKELRKYEEAEEKKKAAAVRPFMPGA